MIDHEAILRKTAAEIRAANINGWGNACDGGADRIAALEARCAELEARCIALVWSVPGETLAGELQEKAQRVLTAEARCRELEGLLSRVNNYRGADFKRIAELEAALRSLVDGVEQSDAYYVKDELTAAHAILEPQTESGTPRGEAGDRAGPLVSPHSAKETPEKPQCRKCGGEHWVGQCTLPP